jgi:hypothetical protein
MGVTSEAGTADIFGATEFIQVVSGLDAARSLSFCVLFCRSFFFFD